MAEDVEFTVGLLAARFDEEYPDHAAEWVADRAVRSIRATERTRLLADLLASRITARRRMQAHAVEQRAAEQASRAVARTEWERMDAERRAGWAEHPYLAPANTRTYRQWAATTEAGRRFEESRVAARDEKRERDRLYREDPVEYDRRFGLSAAWQSMGEAIEAFRQSVRLELTVELLGTAFALGDGRKTTWGAASVEDHEQRIALLMRGIEGSAQTAALHDAAIRMIRDRDAACLNDVRFAA